MMTSFADTSEKKTVNLELRHPQDGGIYIQKNGRTWVRFYWRFNITEPDPVLLEVSPSRKFNEIIKEKVLDKPPYIWMNRMTGRYYWRLSRLNEKGEIKETTPIWEYMISPPAPSIKSEPKELIKFASKSPVLDFAWNDNKNDKFLFYRFKFSADKRFENPIIIKETGRNRIRLEDIPEGKYYWKVGVKHSEYLPIQYSKPYRISIKKSDEITKLPTILAPKEDAVVKVFGELGNVELEWSLIDNAIVYKIEISEEEDFSDIYSQILPENHTKISVAPGVYYWRVKAINFTGEQSKWSKASHFRVREGKQSIDLESPDNDEDISNFEIGFQWESLDGCKDYEFLLAYSSDMSQIIVRKSISANKLNMELDDEGLYFWQVSCESGDNKGIKSSISKFSILIEE